MLGRVKSAKPEEEITVTAGTETKEVLPSSGKTIKKATVNPTPSQSKSVTPSASQKIVAPDAGKLLNKVAVNGDSDLVAGNIKKGVNIFGVNGSFDNSTGLYVWKKDQNDTDHTFVEYAVSDSEDTYPDKAVHTDGYYYEKVEGDITAEMFGCTSMAVDTYTSAEDISYNIIVPHSLGKIPKLVLIIASSDVGYFDVFYADKGYVTHLFILEITDSEVTISVPIGIYAANSKQVKAGTKYPTLISDYITNSSNLLFASDSLHINVSGNSTHGYLKAGVSYDVITMA